ncbi:MAG TPA: alpha/beta hydrolase [Solirubrobacteraceae bacterium]|nr:alpha/beta hydrolase [Solirubrobacteraceae bacterium]
MREGRATEWLEAGSFFEWGPPDKPRAPLRIFHAELGDPAAPLVLLLHGFPTSSIDWYDVAGLLAADHRVALLDFPGFGFSDKPRGGGYSLERDRLLVEHYAAEVLAAGSGAVISHDRGDSVALAFAERCGSPEGAFELRHLVLSNGNMFLPLSNLTGFQRLILDPASAPAVLEALTPEALAAGMGQTTFTPARSPEDPEVIALADTFAHNDGVAVLHDTIQYLVERSRNERGWLDALASSEVPTTLVWGLYDTVSPLRVAAYVWNEFLVQKPGRNEFWLLPEANHYLQNDQPRELVEVVRSAFSDAAPEPGALSAAPGAPVFVDRSRPGLPSAAEVLAQPASLEALQQQAARLEG